MIGSANPNDTTLLIPNELALWGDRIAVWDGSNEVLRTFSRDGRLLWSYSRQGRGPGEMQNVYDIAPGPRGTLWLIDGRNAKILVLDKNGALVDEKPFHHLPVPAGQMLVGGDTVVFMSQFPAYGLMVVDADSLHLISSGPYPWPEPLDPDYNLTLGAAGSHEQGWVGAFAYGPGFMIVNHDSIAVHRYVQYVPWALKSGPRIRAMGADSARYAARSLSIVDDEIFMLFGGRPFRAAHPHEPTLLIDVYDMDGEYRRSYRLPTDAWDMATDDGELFYIITMSEYSTPLVLGLRPHHSS